MSAYAGPVAENKQLHKAEIAEVDKRGWSLYFIEINPFVAEPYHTEALLKGYKPPVKPEKIKDKEDWQQPAILYIRDILSSKYGIESVDVLSWGGLAITSYMPEETARKILEDELVSEVIEVPFNEIVLSQSTCGGSPTAAGDSCSGSETIPWARPAVNVYDSAYNGQYVHLVDTVLPTTLPPGEINLVYRWDQAAPTTYSPYHPLHVAGIIGANSNNARIRGISPNVKIAAHGWNQSSVASLVVAIDNAIYVAETLGVHGQLNMSLNTSNPASNAFAHNGLIGKRMRAASNRNFITESAGNFNAAACNYGFSYPGGTWRAYDGIMLVGAIQLNGSRMTGGTNPFPGSTVAVDGSNYGNCVEAWAPGHEITSLDPVGPSLTRISTGTSYSAPIVASIASRVGATTTRPIQREWYIRNSRVNTGYTDPTGLPIMKAQYVGTSLGTIPKILPIINGWSMTSFTNLTALWDGLYTSGANWNAGANWGSV